MLVCSSLAFLRVLYTLRVCGKYWTCCRQRCCCHIDWVSAAAATFLLVVVVVSRLLPDRRQYVLRAALRFFGEQIRAMRAHYIRTKSIVPHARFGSPLWPRSLLFLSLSLFVTISLSSFHWLNPGASALQALPSTPCPALFLLACRAQAQGRHTEGVSGRVGRLGRVRWRQKGALYIYKSA